MAVSKNRNTHTPGNGLSFFTVRSLATAQCRMLLGEGNKLLAALYLSFDRLTLNNPIESKEGGNGISIEFSTFSTMQRCVVS